MKRARRAWPWVVVVALPLLGEGTGPSGRAHTPPERLREATELLGDVGSTAADLDRLAIRVQALSLLVPDAWCAASLSPEEARAAARMVAREGASLGLHGLAAEAHQRSYGLARTESERAASALETAHALRRDGRTEHARLAYARACREPALEDDDLRDAQLWLGRLAVEQGRLREGEQLLRDVAERADDPGVSIDAYDHLARTALLRRDLGGAAGWIEAARVRWDDAARAHTPRGERVRRALMRIGAIVELRIAIFDSARRDAR